MIYWQITLDASKNVSGSASQLFKTGLPKNINEMPFGLERGDDSGVVAAFSGGLEFVDEMKAYIDKAYTNYSINAIVSIKVEYRRDLDSWTTLANGMLDFETYQHEQFVTTVEIAESDLQKLFTENRNKNYKITPSFNMWRDYAPFAGSTTMTCDIASPFTIEAGSGFTENAVAIPFNIPTSNLNNRLRETTNAVVDVGNDIDMDVYQGFSYVDIRPENEIAIIVKGSYELYPLVTLSTAEYAFFLEIYTAGGDLREATQISSTYTFSTSTTVNDTFTKTVAADSYTQGDSIRVVVRLIDNTVNEGRVRITFDQSGDGSSLSYIANSIDGTLSKSITVLAAFEAVLGQMLADAEAYTFSNTCFNSFGEWKDLLITAGANLTQSLRSGAALDSIEQISISFNDLLDNISPFIPIGYSIDSVSRIITVDSLGSFYKSGTATVIFEDATNIIKKPSDSISNYLQIGSKEQDFEDDEGEEEFNMAQYFDIPVAKKQTIDLESEFRTDSTGINYMLDQQALSSKDTSGSTDIFLIDCNEVVSGIYTPNDLTALTSYSGLSGEATEIYNIVFSPQYCARRNLQAKALLNILQTSTKELALSLNYGYSRFTTVDGGVTINHWENIDIGDLAESLTGLNEYSFDAVLTPEELIYMIANKYKKYTVYLEDNTYISGYLMSVSDEVSDEIARSIKIIEA